MLDVGRRTLSSPVRRPPRASAKEPMRLNGNCCSKVFALTSDDTNHSSAGWFGWQIETIGAGQKIGAFMGKDSNFRDYLYVSARKVARMNKTLTPSRWRNLTDVKLSFGPVAASVSVSADARAEEVISLVPAVETAIERNFGISELVDVNPEPGQWVRVNGIKMAYGVPGYDVGAVVFLGQLADGRHLVLGGSSEYLLDRRIAEDPDGRWGHSASGLRGLRSVLARIARDETEKLRVERGELENVISSHQGWGAREAASKFDAVYRAFGDEVEPFSAIVRCLDVYAHPKWETVLGTPLYVAFYAPEAATLSQTRRRRQITASGSGLSGATSR
jgi:hypothetical protein